jgi:biopolymer transport protein ExbD
MARSTPEIPNASMADIAFLLLTFFLVTTTVANDRGLSIQLPPPPEAVPPTDIKISEKNMFKIQVNSFDNVLVEGEPFTGTTGELKEMIKVFVLNYGKDPNSSDNPEKAVVSYKADRGTSHKKFIEILDAVQGAYYDIYAERIGVTNDRWREIASSLTSDPENQELYDQGRGKRPDGTFEIPMNVSIAEPTKVGGN